MLPITVIGSVTTSRMKARSAPTDKQALQKCRSAPPIISLQAKIRISLTTVAGQSSMDLAAVRIENMVIETVICHFRRRRWIEIPRVPTIRLTLGLSERPATTRAWHVRTVIIPRRTITGRLVRGQVWRRHDGRHWLYKKFIA
jgi:hypothetical protein